MHTSCSSTLDEAANGCLMLVFGIPIFFIVIMAFDAAGWPCRIVMGLSLAFLLLCPRQEVRRTPIITYLPQVTTQEPLITLQPGQFVTVPWPHTLQVHLPDGVRLQVIEASPECIRVMAV
jgi:hypothetical protein